MHSTLEKMAYGHATTLFISSTHESNESWYERYLFLCESVSQKKEPDDWVAWEPFENWPWDSIVEQIEETAASILAMYKQVLSHAKKGIVHSAIVCTLDRDMNSLDMNHMVELGSSEG